MKLFVICNPIQVLSLLEAYFDLISSPSPSMKVQSWVGESGVQIPALEEQNFVCPFSVNLQTLHEKLHIFDDGDEIKSRRGK